MQRTPGPGSSLEGKGQGLGSGLWLGVLSRKPRGGVVANTMRAMYLAGGPGFKAMDRDRGQRPRRCRALSSVGQEEDVRQE